jgi:hypothetical protein
MLGAASKNGSTAGSGGSFNTEVRVNLLSPRRTRRTRMLVGKRLATNEAAA